MYNWILQFDIKGLIEEARQANSEGVLLNIRMCTYTHTTCNYARTYEWANSDGVLLYTHVRVSNLLAHTPPPLYTRAKLKWCVRKAHFVCFYWGSHYWDTHAGCINAWLRTQDETYTHTTCNSRKRAKLTLKVYFCVRKSKVKVMYASGKPTLFLSAVEMFVGTAWRTPPVRVIFTCHITYNFILQFDIMTMHHRVQCVYG